MSLPYLHTSMALHCPIKFKLFNKAYKALDGLALACLPQLSSLPSALCSCQILNYSYFLENSIVFILSLCWCCSRFPWFQFRWSLPLRSTALKARCGVCPTRPMASQIHCNYFPFVCICSRQNRVKARIMWHSPFHTELLTWCSAWVCRRLSKHSCRRGCRLHAYYRPGPGTCWTHTGLPYLILTTILKDGY